ncbi:MAG: hypothetical protein ACXW0L_03840 [Methylosarcina sp.]
MKALITAAFGHFLAQDIADDFSCGSISCHIQQRALPHQLDAQTEMDSRGRKTLVPRRLPKGLDNEIGQLLDRRSGFVGSEFGQGQAGDFDVAVVWRHDCYLENKNDLLAIISRCLGFIDNIRIGISSFFQMIYR